MKYLRFFAAILTGVLVLSACSSSSTATDSGAQAQDSTANNAIPVKIAVLARTRIARTIDYTATVLPFEEVNVVPSTPGRIDRIYVEVGSKVKKGDKLFLMDRTQLYQLKLQLANQAKDLERLDTLLQVGSAKQQQYDQMKTQYDVTKTNVDFMEENTLLRAPFDGVVTGKYFENGEMYTGTPTTQTGRAAVVTVMQTIPLKISLNVSEQYYPLIKNGMNAEVTSDVYGDKKFNAKVYLISPTVNPATRSFEVELELQNRDNLLKPGMFVRVSMDLGEVETFVVPANTVLLQEGTDIRYVFLAKGDTAERMEVKLGKRFDDKLEIISSGISEGDKLIIEGQARLVNGDRIDILK
jgi:membrane fusion protein (multidrug efflux system)